ncbi:MAG: SHOCT domain-containing protein [Thermoleophilaceae bacterium]|nr:SHOCT domain-containing protein [Thermoleophilaceae bacterium]
MRYWLAALLGLGLAAVSIAAATWGLYGLIRTGTCADGGAYQVVQPCPEGTGLRVGGLVGGIFGTLIAIAIYAARGGSGNARRGNAGVLAFGMLMLALSAAALVAAFGPASTDRADSKIGAAIAAFVMLPLGIGPVIYGLRGRRATPSIMGMTGMDSGITIPSMASSVMSGGSSVTPAPAPVPAADQEGEAIDRLERLQALKVSGAITESEFQAKKAEILRDM